MTTFFGAGYSTWRADTTNLVFGQLKGHFSGVPGGIRLVIELGLRHYAHQQIHQV